MGPFDIVDHLGEVAYHLTLPPRLAAIHPVFHISHLKRYLGAGADGRAQGPPPIITDAGYEEYEVNRILKVGLQGRHQQYLVCWKGYTTKEDSWVSRADLGNAPEVLQAWEA